MTRRGRNGHTFGAPTPLNPDYAVIQERVYGLEQGFRAFQNETTGRFDSLSSQIASLGAKLEERAKIPWPALGVMLSALIVIGGLVWWPVREGQGRIDAALVDTRDKYVTQRELDGRLVSSGQRRDDLQRLTDQRLSRIEADLQANEARIVPRGEHAEKWVAQAARDIDTQRQIDDIRKNFSDLYSPKDALTNMQRRIEDLERMIRNRPSG